MNTHGARDLVVDSVTGVELALPLAGAGARCYAFVIDWLIRSILCSAWYAVTALIYNRRWSLGAPLSPDIRWFVYVVAPAAATYFLYHIILEIALHGRTPGKRIAGIQVVARDGSSPGVGALLTRNVFRLVDSLPLFYGVGLVATLVTKDHVRIGDMAAGTLLAYDRAGIVLPWSPLSPPPSRSRDRTVSAADAEVANDLLLRWSTLDSTVRCHLARAIISRYGACGGASLDQESDSTLKAQLETIAQGHTHDRA